MRRALGQQLAALRDAAEIGQQQLARRTGYSRSSVTHAEAGRQLLTRGFWQTVDELLRADGALLASYEQVRAAKQVHEARRREAELAKAYAEAQAQAQALRATATLFQPTKLQNGAGLIVPSGQELVAGCVLGADAELVDRVATPLDYLVFLSNAARCVPGEQGDHI